MIDIIKKINKDKDYNNFFIRFTGILIVIFIINNCLKLFEKYGFWKGLLITIPVSVIIYTLWVFVTGQIYKKLKRIL
jgi:Sec-independent protein secretion pathway component TatC